MVIIEVETENVSSTVTFIGEEKLVACRIVGQGREFGGVVGFQIEFGVLCSIGQKFELVANGNNQICYFGKNSIDLIIRHFRIKKGQSLILRKMVYVIDISINRDDFTINGNTISIDAEVFI